MEAFGHRGPASRCVTVDDALTLPRPTVPRRILDDLAETPRVAPVPAGDRLLAMRAKGVVVAIDPSTDAPVWECPIGGNSWYPNDAAIVARADTAWVFRRLPERGRLPKEGTLLELETATGRIVRETAMPPIDLVEGVIVGDCIVTPREGGIAAIGLDGAPRWHREQPDELDTLAAAEDTVLTNDGGRGLVALELASGQVRWRLGGPPAYFTAIVGEVVLTMMEEDVLALDRSTGEVRWRTTTTARSAQPFATADGEVIIVGHRHVERRSLATGEQLALAQPDRSTVPMLAIAAFFTVPRVTKDLIVVSAPTGPVVAFARETLVVRWRADVSARRATTDPPVIAGGRIYVSDMRGAIDVF